MTDRRGVALHEAAHAVIATLERVPVEYVTLYQRAEVRATPPPGWLNVAVAPARRYMPGDANDPQQRAWIAPRARIALAGPLLDAHVLSEVRDECGDFEHAAQLIAELDLVEGARLRYVERLEAQTSNMLAQHWPALEAIAQLLMTRGTLAGAQVRQIVAKHRALSCLSEALLPGAKPALAN